MKQSPGKYYSSKKGEKITDDLMITASIEGAEMRDSMKLLRNIKDLSNHLIINKNQKNKN
jgi:ribosomal protein S15P/S13E